MIQLLASVTGPQEALIASASGADIIDLKNPADGALGAHLPNMGRPPHDAVTFLIWAQAKLHPHLLFTPLSSHPSVHTLCVGAGEAL